MLRTLRVLRKRGRIEDTNLAAQQAEAFAAEAEQAAEEAARTAATQAQTRLSANAISQLERSAQTDIDWIARLNDEKLEAESRLAKYRTKNHLLAEQLDERTRERDATQTKVEELTKELEGRTAQLAAAQAQIRRLKNEDSANKELLETSSRQNVKLHALLEEEQATIKRMADEIKELKKKLKAAATGAQESKVAEDMESFMDEFYIGPPQSSGEPSGGRASLSMLFVPEPAERARARHAAATTTTETPAEPAPAPLFVVPRLGS